MAPASRRGQGADRRERAHSVRIRVRIDPHPPPQGEGGEIEMPFPASGEGEMEMPFWAPSSARERAQPHLSAGIEPRQALIKPDARR